MFSIGEALTKQCRVSVCQSLQQRGSTSRALRASPPCPSAVAARGGEVSLFRGSCWLMIHGERSTPFPCQGIRLVRLGARSTGRTFKTLSPRRGIRQPRFGTQCWIWLQNLYPVTGKMTLDPLASRPTIQSTASKFKNHKKVYFKSQTARAKHIPKV